MADAEAEKSGLKFRDVKIVREGKQIILPDGMSYAEGRVWLSRQEEAEEKVVGISASIPCFPLDGVIALRRAMDERYGFTALADVMTFWGPKPPTMVQVETSVAGTFEAAPFGRIQPPLLEGGHLMAGCGTMTLEIKGEVKKKFEPECQAIIARTKEMLQEHSIYRGTAFILDLEWMVKGQDFHPVEHAPKFMDVSDVSEGSLILNRDTMASLQINVFTLVEKTDACRRNGIPLKHGCILVGPYGTGKTMTAWVTASKAVRNGWTFLYLKTPRAIAQALKLAEMYAPAVVFTEDIDNVVGEDRNEHVNTILNTLDGVDTKDKPIITILTTNHVEDINPAFLRPGRMDTVVKFTEPDAESAVKFVMVYGRDDDGRTLMAPMTEDEAKQVGVSLQGYVPAFIAEAVQKAKRLAIAENGDDIIGKVTAQHLIDAAAVLRSHKELMERKTTRSDEEMVADAVARINNHC